MTRVELSQQRIKLDPPQHLIMLEVTSDAHGLCLRIFPAGGQVKDLHLVRRTLVPVSIAGTDSELNAGAFDSTAMMCRLSQAFPVLTEIDLRMVPAAYDVTFGQALSSPFHFKPGERYRVSGVGEHVWETTVVAT